MYILKGGIIPGIVETAAFISKAALIQPKKITILESRKYTDLTKYAEVIIADCLSLIPEIIFIMTLN